MLLEEAVQIIDFTDTDSFAEAMDLFNQEGVISSSMLPYMKVVLDTAPAQLCTKLKSVGFKGKVELVRPHNSDSANDYVIYDAERYSQDKLAAFL